MIKIEELNFEIVHVGINCQDESNALNLAEMFLEKFGFDYKTGNSSIFSANRKIEIMKKPGRGTCGHLAVGTSDIELAENFLKSKGYLFDEESRVIKDGKTVAIYLKGEMGGFAVHLVQK